MASNNKKINIRKLSIISIILVIITYIIYRIYVNFKLSVTTETAQLFTFNDEIKSTALILRDETVIFHENKPANIKYSTHDGGRIGSQHAVAYIFNSESEAINYEKICKINKKLEQLNNISKYKFEPLSTYELNNAKSYYEIINFLKNPELNFLNFSDNIFSFLMQREKILKENADFSGQISELENQKNISGNLQDNTKIIYSQTFGYFFQNTDGYENFLDYNNLNKIKLSDLNFENIYENKIAESKNIIGKIINPNDLILLCKVSKTDAEKFRINSYFEIDFDTLNKNSFLCKLLDVNEGENSDDALVTFSCGEMNDFLSKIRREPVKIKIGSYYGVKIPKFAIHNIEKPESQGVYVKHVNRLCFKKINIIYSSNDFVICEYIENSGQSMANLQIGDKIVVKGDNLYENKIVK